MTKTTKALKAVLEDSVRQLYLTNREQKLIGQLLSDYDELANKNRELKARIEQVSMMNLQMRDHGLPFFNRSTEREFLNRVLDILHSSIEPEEPLPEWATGFAYGDYTIPYASLPTKDGRTTGNAVNLGLIPSLNPHPTYLVVTDAGNELKLTENEIKDLFHPPVFIMAEVLPHLKDKEEL